MPTKSEIQRQVKRKQRAKSKRQKFGKVIGIILAVILVVGGSAVAVIYGSNIYKTNKEIEILKENKLYNPIEIDDGKSITVAISGNNKSKYTVVTIADVNVHDYSVFVQHMTNSLNKQLQIALIDRAGIGISDDSKQEQTVEQIISDYRSALTKADVKGKYILLAHGFGSVYATYWQMEYPDEVAGVIYLNGLEILDDHQIDNYEVTPNDKITSVLCDLGFQRLLYKDLYSYAAKSITQSEAECAKYLHTNNIKSNASLSEMALMKENYETVLNMLKKTDIPKVYLSSINAFRTEDEVTEYFKYMNEVHENKELEQYFDFNRNEKEIAKEISDFINNCTKKYENETVKFVDALGNCHLSKMPGDEKIYEYRPDGITGLISDFVLYLEGQIGEMEEYYSDTTRDKWEDYFNSQQGKK